MGEHIIDWYINLLCDGDLNHWMREEVTVKQMEDLCHSLLTITQESGANNVNPG